MIDATTVAQELLAAVVAHYAAVTIPGHPPLPERQYVPAGDPIAVPWDCEQLTVSLQGIGWGPAIDVQPVSPRSGSPMSVAGMRHAVYVVSLVRCVPTVDSRGHAPKIPAMMAAGLTYTRDAGLVSQALHEYCVALGRRLMPGETVQAGAVEPAGPDGSYLGVIAPLVVTVGNLV
jgi:hypothetical protein